MKAIIRTHWSFQEITQCYRCAEHEYLDNKLYGDIAWPNSLYIKMQGKTMTKIYLKHCGL